MVRIFCIALTFGLLLSPAISQATDVHSPTRALTEPSALDVSPPPQSQAAVQTAGGAPDATPPATSPTTPAASPSAQTAQSPAASDKQTTHGKLRPPAEDNLQEQSRLDILRNVSGEYARLVTPFPGGKKGFHIKAGEPIDQDALRKAIQSGSAILNTGDTVQITKIEFRNRELLVELNGGGRGHTSWRDHVQMGMGGMGPVMTSSTTTTNTQQVPVTPPKAGATFYLDFDRATPGMTSDELKRYLSVVLDFSKQRSASVQWASTLPPKVQEAIAEKRPDVGMDREEILAALGRPDRKVRERDADGNDTEDWIYGHPPAKTIFVRFEADKVVQVDQYP